MPCSGSSALHGVNPNFKKCAVMYSDILGRLFMRISAGGLGGVGDCDAPLWVYAKLWLGPGGKAPGNSKDLVLWNHFLLIKIYPPQPVMKLIQHFFSKILLKLELEVNFSKCSYHYVYYLKYTELKAFVGNEFWNPNWYTSFKICLDMSMIYTATTWVPRTLEDLSGKSFFKHS